MPDAGITLRDAIRWFVPPWMTDRVSQGLTTGYKYLYSHALFGDLLIQFAIEGVTAKFPDFAPEDALSTMGRDRKIRRGMGESSLSYRARLIRWRDDWKTAGSAYAIMRQLRAYLQTPGTIRIVSANGTWWTLHPDNSVSKLVTLPAKNWDWDGNSAKWARFWVVLYAADYGWTRDGTWGDGELWGDSATSTIGANVPIEVVQTVRAIISEWKSGFSVCKNVLVSFDPAYPDPVASPGAPNPDGTWGAEYKLVAGVAVPNKDARLLYWAGTS